MWSSGDGTERHRRVVQMDVMSRPQRGGVSVQEASLVITLFPVTAL